eukprot:gene15457-biopygen12862
MDEFEKLKKKRSLYRRSATNLVKRDFDERILDFIIEYEDEDGEKEMDDAMDYRDKIIGAIVSTEKQLEKIAENESIASPRGRRDSLESIQSVRSDDSQGTTMKRRTPVKLPALELSKFSGKIHEWSEFWDSFCSAVNDNENLADVDKLKYLRGFLEEPARSVIAGIRRLTHPTKPQ